jgi:uncharacterized protein (DUF169 family)
LYRDLAHRFSTLLQLQQPPIGLAFIDGIPEDIPHSTVGVPSACTFWRLGEQGVFYATADDHKQCPIGMMTMGFVMPESDQQRAQSLVETMASVQYFSPAEVSALPVVRKPHESIVYGRLDRFPMEADVVLCIIDTRQAMLIAEAMGNMNWLQGGGQSAFGRPTCAVIPRTLHTGQHVHELRLYRRSHLYRPLCFRAGIDAPRQRLCRAGRKVAHHRCGQCCPGAISPAAESPL